MLQALGCDPTAKGQSIDDIGGAALGSIGYSEDGRLWIAVQANGAVSQYELCFLGGGFQATPKGTNVTGYGRPCAVPQQAFADNDYGWMLIAGEGRVRTDGSVASGDGLELNATDEELDTAAAGATPIINGMVATGDDGADDGPVLVMFPSVGTGVS